MVTGREKRMSKKYENVLVATLRAKAVLDKVEKAALVFYEEALVLIQRVEKERKNKGKTDNRKG